MVIVSVDRKDSDSNGDTNIFTYSLKYNIAAKTVDILDDLCFTDDYFPDGSNFFLSEFHERLKLERGFKCIG